MTESPSDIPHHPPLADAIDHHQGGRLDEAQTIYEAILCRQPKNFDAIHLLGVVHLQRGRFVQAQRLLNEALAINWVDPAVMGNLGTSYLRNGQLLQALHWFEIALRLSPDSILAAMNVAAALELDCRHQDAVPVLRRLLARGIATFDAWNLLGICLMKSGRSEEAVDAFEAATGIQPDDPQGWANLCAALSASGHSELAHDLAHRSMGYQPQFGQQPVRLDSAPTRAAIDVPPSVAMLVDSAKILIANGFNGDAIIHLRQAMQQDENDLAIRWMLAIAVLKPVYQSDSEMRESRQSLAKSLDEIAAWCAAKKPVAPYAAIGTVQPFFLVYHPYSNRQLLSRYGVICAQWMETIRSTAPRVPGLKQRSSHRNKLRLGIVSSHIRDHSIWAAITRGWVHHLDRSKIDVYLFHLNEAVDLETLAAKNSVFHFENEQKETYQWMESIEDRDLDALIYPEVGLDPSTLKLAALRLAPWQAVAWGQPETTGLPTMDAFLSAADLEPSAACDNYTETLVRLPNLGVYCEPLRPDVSRINIVSLGLSPAEPLLLCPGSPFKYAPAYDDVWVRIALGLRHGMFRRKSRGRLVFFRSQTASLDRALEARLRAAFEDAGIDFDAHVSIIPYLNRSQFYSLMEQSSLMLDTLGFSGFNTALQAVEGGLPILSFDGDFLRGRLASGIMRRLGLPELIATTKDQFVEKAVALMSGGTLLSELQQRMIDFRHILFRDLESVRSLEKYLLTEIPKSRI